MRIISGKARGRRLKTLPGNNTRPTTDRVKETIFNLIQSYVMDSSVLDLFSGSGSLGLEALSRGASSATLVEGNRKAQKIIEENINIVNMENANLIKKDVYSYIPNEAFDIIFMDPPYDKQHVSKTLHHIIEYNMLKEDGILIIEHSKTEKMIEDLPFELIKSREYGITSISILKNSK